LLLLFPDCSPLLVRDHLGFLVGAVLADHREGRQEDGLYRHDHRQQVLAMLQMSLTNPELVDHAGL
jgi:hypothetical protein